MGSGVDDSNERTVYVGQLAPGVTGDLLHELFLQTGPLEGVDMFLKTSDGRCTKLDDAKPVARADAPMNPAGFRFALIRFVHDVSVPFAVRVLHGVRLCGQQLDVKPKQGSRHEKNFRENFQRKPRISHMSKSDGFGLPAPPSLMGRHFSDPAQAGAGFGNMPGVAQGYGSSDDVNMARLNYMAGWGPPPPPPIPPESMFQLATPPPPPPSLAPFQQNRRQMANSAPGPMRSEVREMDRDYRRPAHQQQRRPYDGAGSHNGRRQDFDGRIASGAGRDRRRW